MKLFKFDFVELKVRFSCIALLAKNVTVDRRKLGDDDFFDVAVGVAEDADGADAV